MMLDRSFNLFILVFSILLALVCSRKHHLYLEDDRRPIIHITTFGFLKGGYLIVDLKDLILNSEDEKAFKKEKSLMGFTVDRTMSDGINPYSHNIDNSICALRGEFDDQAVSSITLSFDFDDQITVKCNRILSKVKIFTTPDQLRTYSGMGFSKRNIHVSNIMMTQRKKREENNVPDPKAFQDLSHGKVVSPPNAVPQDTNLVNPEKNEDMPKPPENHSEATKNENVNKEPSNAAGENIKAPPEPVKNENEKNEENPLNEEDQIKNEDGSENSDKQLISESDNDCESVQIPLKKRVFIDSGEAKVSYSTYFAVYVTSEMHEGLYNLYFHNCIRFESVPIQLNLSITEKNRENFLSAGEMPLPSLYLTMSFLFFISGCFWIFILRKSKKELGVVIFKVHYMMGTLVFFKSFSLLFNAINYHYIQTLGTHVEGWAVLYYITHLVKGALLFITILLIGTGYAFVKHLLSDRDKRTFMIVIPLQILANVAEIIIDESEEGEIRHAYWKVIFISVDLLCCGAILFPVVWSIRHLQEASETDGKAATNLRKLKLFRHFYIIVVCYIYFTRIVVNMLLKITVPFQYEWLVEMFQHMTTFIFFVLTGYKFRPAANNPYLELAHDSDDETEMDIALTESGLTQGLNKRGPRYKKRSLKEIVIFDPNEEDSDDEEVLLEKRREASHDFD